MAKCQLLGESSRSLADHVTGPKAIGGRLSVRSVIIRLMPRTTTRKLARQAVDRARRVRRRDETPYATHAPVLIALAQVMRVRRVLEFGAGMYSTLLFLNRVAFPELMEIVSYEDDADWAKRVALDAAGDDRLSMRTVASVPECVPDTIDDFDLILIDDSSSATIRTRTVLSVANRRPINALVAIHDYELRELALATRSFDHVYCFRTFTPQVGVAWFGDAMSKRLLSQTESRIARHRTSLPVADIARWTTALHRQPK